MSDNPVQEAITNLTETDGLVKALKASWKYLEADKKKHGVELFIRLFKSAPAAQDYFEQFKGLAPDDLKDNRKMKGHATTFMYGLKSFMDYVDDPEMLEDMIRKTAKNHVKRNIKSPQFQLLGPVVLEYLGEIMGDEFTKEKTTDAWVGLLKVIITIVDDEASNL